jgi:nitrite reductase/ring-hydroxylating ferredoxin subunit
MKKITKIISLGILFLFVWTLQLSAQKCNVKVEIDGGTCAKEKKSFLVLFAQNCKEFKEDEPAIQFFKFKNTYKVRVWMVLSQNHQIEFELSTGEVFKLKPQKEVSCNRSFDIDIALLQKIAKDSPTFIRITVDKNDVWVLGLSNSEGTKMAKAAAKILK